jgi:hypothetical protein
MWFKVRRLLQMPERQTLSKLRENNELIIYLKEEINEYLKHY